jgi:CRP-like cAMP-binding protein
MPDLDPATLAERVLRLSRSPPFDQMPVEDVTVLAAAGREQSFPTRTVLVHAGERSMAHYVPLAGRLQLSDHLVEATGTYGGVGALSVLGGVVLPADLVAHPGSVVLVLDADALLNVLEEHGHVARMVLRQIALKLLEFRRTSSPSRPPRPPPTVRLDLVSRMLTLREALGLGIDGMATVARLARVARARQFSAGANVFDGHQPADVLILLEGSLLLKGPGTAERTVRPGEVLGLVEAVAGVPIGLPATASSETTTLLLSHHELAEDIEDEDALCLELIKSFAAQLWTEITHAGPWKDLADIGDRLRGSEDRAAMPAKS